MELFAKIVNEWAVNYIRKSSILDIRVGSEYASVFFFVVVFA